MIIIAAADIKGGIGYQDKLLFSIPEDMKFFKEKTAGKTVVMGRKTFETLKIKPLPGRRNIVMTTDLSFSCSDTETVHSVQELLRLVREIPKDDIFVIGGAEIYCLLEKYCDTAYITRIYAERKADRFIPDFSRLPDWEKAEMSGIKEYDGLKFRFITYTKTAEISGL